MEPLLSPNKPKKQFTLLEVMILVALVGWLLMIGVPKFMEYKQRAEVKNVAYYATVFAKGFRTYSMAFDRYPLENERILPKVMESYINRKKFESKQPFGGHWNWEGPDKYGFAGLSIDDPAAPLSQLIEFDKAMDDGNLSTGRVRWMWHGPGAPCPRRVVYVIEWGINPSAPFGNGYTIPKS